MRQALASALLFAMIFAAPAAVAATDAQTASYTAAGGNLVLVCGTPVGNLGGACFQVPSSFATANITVQDAVSPLVAFWVSFSGPGLSGVLQGPYCGNTSVATGHATHLEVAVDQADGPQSCGLTALPPTTGNITVTLSD